MGKDPSRIREEIEATRGRMSETVEAIGYRADVPSRMRENIAEKVESVKEKFSGGVDAVKSRLSDLGGNVGEAIPSREDIRRSARRAASIAAENPLGLALGGLALGFVAGLLIPTTRAESNALRPVAENVKRMAQDAGQSVMQHGKEVLHDVAGSAKDSVQRHGQQVASELRDRVGGSESVGSSGRSGNTRNQSNDDLTSTAGTPSVTGRGSDAP